MNPLSIVKSKIIINYNRYIVANLDQPKLILGLSRLSLTINVRKYKSKQSVTNDLLKQKSLTQINV